MNVPNWNNWQEVAALPAQWIIDNVDHKAAFDLFKEPAFSAAPSGGVNGPGTPEPIQWKYLVSVGDWIAYAWDGAEHIDFAVLLHLPIDSFQPSEGEWDLALRWPCTQQYIEWCKAGHLPPPPYVSQTTSNTLSSCNRRRWLAARAAGHTHMYVWFSATGQTRDEPMYKWFIERENLKI